VNELQLPLQLRPCSWLSNMWTLPRIEVLVLLNVNLCFFFLGPRWGHASDAHGHHDIRLLILRVEGLRSDHSCRGSTFEGETHLSFGSNRLQKLH